MLTSTITDTKGIKVADALHIAVNEVSGRFETEGGNYGRAELVFPDYTITLLMLLHTAGTHLAATVEDDLPPGFGATAQEAQAALFDLPGDFLSSFSAEEFADVINRALLLKIRPEGIL